MTEKNKQYSGVLNIILLYWDAYGGAQALRSSPYLHFSVLLTVLLSHYWITDAWWETALSTLPNLLGFTLTGFTIWLGFGDERFQRLVTKPGRNGKASAYMGVSAGFVHFVLSQFFALLLALCAKALAFDLPKCHWLNPISAFFDPAFQAIGFLTFIYALTTIMAATLAVFRTASWNEKSLVTKKKIVLFKITQKRKPHP